MTQRDAHLHNTTEMAAAFREALPGRRGARCWWSAARGSTSPRRPSSASTGCSGGARRPARWPRTSCTLSCHPRAPAARQTRQASTSDPRLGLTVTHRRYVPYSHAHYAGNLVDGAYSLALFGDVATEVCIRTDGDEGLFASYSDVQFLAPVRAGDVLEVTARVVRVGRRSREIDFEARWSAGAGPTAAGVAAEVLDPPLLATTARGTVVVPRPYGLKRDTPCDTPVQNAFTRLAGRPDTASMTCDDGESGRSRAP